MNNTNRKTEIHANLYLVGLMGTGKTTIGELLATRLGMKFIDSDLAIEKSTGMSVSQIFSTHGESHFRKLEEKFIVSEHPQNNCVIACGGGLCIPNGMMEELKSRGKVICLWASAETLFDRTKMDRSRPLLQDSKPLDILKNLIEERKSRYREADLVVETDNLSPELVVENILKESC